MIKKKVAFFFILIANIILLGHSVISHHHHQTEVCIDNSHCESNGNHNSNFNFNQEDNHKHDSSNNYEYCVLKQIAVTSSNLSKRELKNVDNGNNYFPLLNFQAILLNSDKEAFVPIKIQIAISLSIKPFSNFVNTSLSLRGPPTV